MVHSEMSPNKYWLGCHDMHVHVTLMNELQQETPSANGKRLAFLMIKIVHSRPAKHRHINIVSMLVC